MRSINIFISIQSLEAYSNLSEFSKPNSSKLYIYKQKESDGNKKKNFLSISLYPLYQYLQFRVSKPCYVMLTSCG